jgi:hypothetical protein
VSALLTAAAFAAALQSSADDGKYSYKDKNWAVFETGRTCTLIGFFESKKIIWLRYNYDLNEVLFTLTGPNFQSAAAEKTYLAKVEFVEGDSFSKRYQMTSFRGTKRGNDGGIEYTFPAREFLGYFASSRIIAVSLKDDKIIASLDLARSAKAIASLKDCSKQIAELLPSDPLDGAQTPSFFKAQ